MWIGTYWVIRLYARIVKTCEHVSWDSCQPSFWAKKTQSIEIGMFYALMFSELNHLFISFLLPLHLLPLNPILFCFKEI